MSPSDTLFWRCVFAGFLLLLGVALWPFLVPRRKMRATVLEAERESRFYRPARLRGPTPPPRVVKVCMLCLELESGKSKRYDCPERFFTQCAVGTAVSCIVKGKRIVDLRVLNSLLD